MLKISGTELVNEFDLNKALKKTGEDIEISACVHKVKKMGGYFMRAAVLSVYPQNMNEVLKYHSYFNGDKFQLADFKKYFAGKY